MLKFETEGLNKSGINNLLHTELIAKKKLKENEALEKFKNTQKELREKLIKARKRENLIKSKKTFKEMMQKSLFDFNIRKKSLKEEEVIDDTFNDKYFVD